MTVQLDDLVTKLVLDSTGFNTGVTGAKSSASGLSTSMTGAFKAIGLGGVLQFASVTGAIAGTIAAFKELYTSTLEYGDAVRSLSMANGLTAEQASILIQVTDDYKLSVDDLTTASRKLTSEGLSMTVETLAQLSDEYLALNTPAERQLFLQEHLGRAGAQWNELMLAGGDAIRANGDAVSANNILSQAQLDLQRENQAQLDRATDAWDGLKNVLGNLVMGPGAQFLEWLANSIEGWGAFFEFYNLFKEGGGWGGLLFPNFPTASKPGDVTPKDERDQMQALPGASNSTTNIIINNPSPEAAETSVARELRIQSYLGGR